MARPATILLDASARESAVSRFFACTVPLFTPEMGARLIAARKKLKLNQRQLAERLGLNQTDVSRLEKGKNINAMPNCAKFKNVLGDLFDKVLVDGGFIKDSEISVHKNKQINRYVGSRLRNY